MLNIITGSLPSGIKVTEGEVRVNPRLKVGRYNQHFVDILPMGETPVDYLRRQFPVRGRIVVRALRCVYSVFFARTKRTNPVVMSWERWGWKVMLIASA